MKHLFVPYEQALALKELGFDEPCFEFFYEICEDNDKIGCSGKSQSMCGWIVGRETTDDLSSHDFIVIRPTFSQAFRWFRNNHDLEGDVTHFNDNRFKWSFQVKNITNNPEESKMLFSQPFFETYEEAELDCLKKLIEIVKNKKG